LQFRQAPPRDVAEERQRQVKVGRGRRAPLSVARDVLRQRIEARSQRGSGDQREEEPQRFAAAAGPKAPFRAAVPAGGALAAGARPVAVASGPCDAAELRAAGVDVQWSSPKFYVTHEKSIVDDNRAAMVATYNLMIKYFTLTRDYGIITYDPQHIEQIIDVFNADWEHVEFTPQHDAGLLWSNSNSRYQMARFIDRATTHLHVQHPKYVDAVILDRLVAAADRGVKIKVLCGGKHGISEWDILDTFSSLRTLRRFGVKVHKQKNLRVHAKLIILDGREALVGSMNIDRSAFDLRRELGIIVDEPEIVDRLRRVFKSDWKTSHRYEAPDPLGHAEVVEDDFPHDHDLVHE